MDVDRAAAYANGLIWGTYIVMEVAIVESRDAVQDVQPPALQNKEGEVTESSFNGVIGEVPGRVQNPSTHVAKSFIMIYLAVVDGHCVGTPRLYTHPPALQNMEGT